MGHVLARQSPGRMSDDIASDRQITLPSLLVELARNRRTWLVHGSIMKRCKSEDRVRDRRLGKSRGTSGPLTEMLLKLFSSSDYVEHAGTGP